MQGITATFARLSLSIGLLMLAAVFGQFQILTPQAAGPDTAPATPHGPDPAVQSTVIPAVSASGLPLRDITGAVATAGPAGPILALQEYAVPAGAWPHDVAALPDGGVWYTAQRLGALGRLDPVTGLGRLWPLGAGSAPEGLILGPDGALWAADPGLQAILRFDPTTLSQRSFLLPASQLGAGPASLAFDDQGRLWFAGTDGVLGRLDPASGQLTFFKALHGRGRYSLAAGRNGQVYYGAPAAGAIGRLTAAGAPAAPLQPPTANGGVRGIASDMGGNLWLSQWNVGQIARYEPAQDTWRAWKLPGGEAMPYAVYVDWQGQLWVSDLAASALLRFNPASGQFASLSLPSAPANVHQLAGRPGEVWGAEPEVDKLLIVRVK